MTVPNVTFRVLNGKLGVRAPGGVEKMAVVGPCSSGAVNTPTRHVRSDDLLATYVSGPAAELAVGAIERWKADVLMVRATASTPGAYGDIDVTNVTGASVVTVDETTHPDDDYEVVVEIVEGGTVGTDGITYRTSLDNGRTWSPVLALGTANTLTIANSGGIKFALAAGTLLADDTWSIPAIAPASSTADLLAALAPLKASQQDWEAVWIVGPVDAAAAAVIQTFLSGLEATTGKSRKAYVGARVPNAGETEAAYLTALSTDFAGFAEKKITCCAGAARVLSARPGRPFIFRRSALFAIAGLPAALPLSTDMAQTVDATPGGLPGVWLYDSNGNQVEHDEMLNPGLSDARFLTLRTWAGKTGVYVNDPVTLEAVGGDFHLDQMVRILCKYCTTARSALVDEVSRALDLNRQTKGANIAGAPTEAECQRIDARVREALLAVLRTHVSGVEFAMHRDDLVLTTQKLNADGGIFFKGYPKAIEFTVAAINPAA